MLTLLLFLFQSLIAVVVTLFITVINRDIKYKKDVGRLNRFPAQSLSVYGGFCDLCIECLLHSP